VDFIRVLADAAPHETGDGSLELETERLILRPATPDDAPAIAAFKRDPVVREMALGKGHEATEKGERADLDVAAADVDQLYVIIVRKDGHRPIGYLRVNWMERHRFAWLRFALGEDREKGHMREALTAFLGRLFDEGLHRVDAEAYAKNERSIRLMEGLGFRREGRKREAHFDGDSYSDIVVFGLLKGDFRPASR
jgi:RimJ/RimL family protein N-acetyltransferase